MVVVGRGEAVSAKDCRECFSCAAFLRSNSLHDVEESLPLQCRDFQWDIHAQHFARGPHDTQAQGSQIP